MYKSLSEMEPGQKFVNEGEILTIYSLCIDGIATDIDYGANWQDGNVDWVATNALYAETDTYTTEIHALLEAQKVKGLSKYGVTLENGTVGVIEVIDHAMAEAVDLLFYLTHLKSKLREKGD